MTTVTKVVRAETVRFEDGDINTDGRTIYYIDNGEVYGFPYHHNTKVNMVIKKIEEEGYEFIEYPEGVLEFIENALVNPEIVMEIPNVS